jgi:hypothetical protein
VSKIIEFIEDTLGWTIKCADKGQGLDLIKNFQE